MNNPLDQMDFSPATCIEYHCQSCAHDSSDIEQAIIDGKWWSAACVFLHFQAEIERIALDECCTTDFDQEKFVEGLEISDMTVYDDTQELEGFQVATPFGDQESVTVIMEDIENAKEIGK